MPEAMSFRLYLSLLMRNSARHVRQSLVTPQGNPPMFLARHDAEARANLLFRTKTFVRSARRPIAYLCCRISNAANAAHAALEEIERKKALVTRQAQEAAGY